LKELYVRALAIAGFALLAACSGGSMNQTVPAGTTGGPVPMLGLNNNAPNTRALCDFLPAPGYARCFALARTDVTPRKGVQPNFTPSGFGPPDLVSAYKLPHGLLSGKGQIIAAVDAYDDPNAESDLAIYRTQFGLPTCSTANKCFQKVNQSGQTSPLPQPNAGWAGEISLDLDMVSAACPHCKIILVEATSNSFANLGTSNDTAVNMKANAVSNSYGGGESGGTNSHYDHPGHIILASSGDGGYGAQSPCSYATVVCVGGTHLTRGGGTRGWTETAWRGAGSGCSGVVLKPSWQTDTGCTMRSESDVSSVADPSSGVAVYDTYQSHGWQVYGGTSASSPFIAGVYGLAKNAAKQNYAASIWAAGGSKKLNDVTSGSNGTCPSQYLYICTAGVGYDGPTGWGTPWGVKAF